MEVFCIVVLIICVIVSIIMSNAEESKKNELERKEQERKEQEQKELERKRQLENAERKQREEKRRRELEMTKNTWVKQSGRIVDADDYKVFSKASSKPYLKNNFYVSSYGCPHCGGVMYKTVFPVGGEYMIETSTETMYLKRAFTCDTCNKFFAPIPGQRLSDGEYMERTLSYGEYQNYLSQMNMRGSTVGRSDA